MCPNRYYTLMRESKDSRHLRLRMVRNAQNIGVKPTAVLFGTTPKTVRKWLQRFDGTLLSLTDHSRAPKRPARRLTKHDVRRIVQLKKKYPRFGAERLKAMYELPYSPATIRKVAKAHGLQKIRRRKKHQTKHNLREIKRQWALFQQSDIDTKDLSDIPEYWIQMQTLGLPRYQYTFREVSSGLLFLGFSNELSLTYATLFAQYIIQYLQTCRVDLSRATWQSDNGSEFIGSWQAKDDSIFTKAVESVPGQKHSTIPPGAHRFQADVETVHNLIEIEFYEIETFTDRTHFLAKANSYQLWFNLARKNSGKENKTPWQLILEKQLHTDSRLTLLPPVFLEDLFKINHSSLLPGGYHVSIAPSIGSELPPPNSNLGGFQGTCVFRRIRSADPLPFDR